MFLQLLQIDSLFAKKIDDNFMKIETRCAVFIQFFSVVWVLKIEFIWKFEISWVNLHEDHTRFKGNFRIEIVFIF